MFDFSISQDNDSVTVETVKEVLDEKDGTIILDVRMPEEYAAGHIAGSRLIPLPELPENLVKIPDKSKKIFVYCRSGGRSGRAVAFLRQLGYTDVYNVAGGIIAWMEKGYPLEK